MKKIFFVVLLLLIFCVSCFAIIFETQTNEETGKKELIAYTGNNYKVNISEGIQHICSGVFDNNEKISEIIFPKSLETIDNDVFFNIPRLDKISVNTYNKNFSSLNGVLYSKDKKTIYAYPQDKLVDVFVIPNMTENISSYCFGNCSHVSKITMQNKIKSIGKGAFYNCVSLKNIVLSDNIKEIPEQCFYNCKGLKELYIPKSIEKISSKAFENSNISSLYFDETDLGIVSALVKDLDSKYINYIYYKDENDKYVYVYLYEIKKNNNDEETNEEPNDEDGEFTLDFTVN